MPTDKLKNRAPAPVVTDTRTHKKWKLEGVSKFPHRSPISNLTLLRFVAPSHAHPEGLVVAKGYPPFKPSVIGMSIHAD